MVYHKNTYEHNYDLINVSLILMKKKMNCFVTVEEHRNCSDPWDDKHQFTASVQHYLSCCEQINTQGILDTKRYKL